VKPAPLRVAFHAINGVGLGHLVRAMCVAKEVLAASPGSQVLVLTNARDPSMLTAAGVDFVQFPARLAEPHADPSRVETALLEDEEDAALGAALGAFAPHVVVFDTHAPPRLVARATELGARTVLVLRELRPEALAAFLASGAARAFDRVVVPHEPSEVDARPLEAAGLSVRVVGPVVRPGATLQAPSRARKGAPRVVALAGGGGQPVDARRYMRAVADAHLLARARVPSLETVLVTGPYGAPPEGVRGLRGLTVKGALPDLGPLLASATLVVSQCGYNAVAELRALRKPAVLVPAYRKSEDQSARARRLARVGAAVLARPEARSIASRVEVLLTTPGALDAMSAAHERAPLVPGNRAAAEAVLSPVLRPGGPVRRVVLVAHDLAPRLGGMETVARALAKELLARGVDVRVYTTRRLGAGDPAVSGLPEGVVLPMFRPRPRPGRIDLEADLLATLEQALRDEPDVVHLCHAGLAPWVPSLQASLPAVVTVSVHGNDLLAPWVHHGDREESYEIKQLEGLRAAAGVFAVSEFSASLARARGVEGARVFPNGVDVSRFEPGHRGPKERALAARLGLEPGDEVVLTVSRLAPRKGHATVVRAVARLARERPRLRFVYTGASDALHAELRALADELGVTSSVVAAGRVPEDELPALYRLADVFALLAEEPTPSDVEGFGVALLEAAASGVPQVASRSGGIPEAVEDGRTGLLVPPGDDVAAARALARVLDERGLAAELGARSRARAVASFSEARACGRVLDAWTAAAARPLRTSASPDGARLARAARERAASMRREREARAASFRGAIERERGVRLRATGEGDRLLPEVLADCASLGHRPTVEVKLRRFVEADFQAHALPLVGAVEVAHGVPFPSASALLETLRGLPSSSIDRVRVVRLFLTPDARASDAIAVRAVPEAHALRRFFGDRGATVVPPPELMRYLSAVPAGGPETGMIEPTNLCNLACPTCPTGTGKIKPLPQMSLGAFGGVLDQLTPRLRNLALWNYGEPLLNRDLPGMIAHAKAAGVGVVKVSSNVHFLDGARGEALLLSGLDVLILSVDGASQATYQTFRKDGEFDRVAGSVARLCAEKKRLGLAKPRIELQFIAMRHNEHELPEMRRLAREWGVDALRVKTVGADDEGSRGLVPATRLLSRYGADGVTPNTHHAFCTMAWDHTVVNVDGSVTPCCYLRPDMGPEFVMGNVFETPFLSVWRGERYRRFREAMLAGRAGMPVCGTCRGGTHDLLVAVEAVAPS
jgi:radical SAM protein with 4Fe4S-binding SPASM domain